MSERDKIYYESHNGLRSYTPCKLNDCMVGSINCQKCEHHISFDKLEQSVQCKMIADAK